MSYSIKEALEYASSLLQSHRPQLESEILLCFILGIQRVDLHTHSEYVLTPSEFEKFAQLVLRASNHEPIEYITQKVSFYDWEFEIFQGVLIPRPETEILVEKCDELIKKEKINSVFELGVGSGVICISLALLNPSITIMASDINPLALKLAQKNIDSLSRLDSSLLNRINLYDGDVLQDSTFFNVKHFDLWVSNPPYIANDYILPQNVTYEPKEALFGGERGDEILKKIIHLAREYHIPHLACEMGWDQKESLAQELKDFKEVDFYKDLSGLNRGFIAKR